MCAYLSLRSLWGASSCLYCFLWCKSSEKLWGAQSLFVRIFIVKMPVFCYERHVFSSVFSVSIKKWHKCLVVMSEKDIFVTCYIEAPRWRFCVRHVEIILFIV